MTQAFRLPSGGVIDRSRPVGFSFDGVRYQGFRGDTLASALLANGVHLCGRSFKYHRPRGIFGAGAEEPNALVQVSQGPRSEPNVRATTLELHENLLAASQNCWPSVRFDVSAVNDLISGLIPAGFYYKTFMWPGGPRWWLKYEHAIRHAAGLGRAASQRDTDRYEHRYTHCDVLVVGGGIAGLAAARAATASGARVILCDDGNAWGGSLLGSPLVIDDTPLADWIATTTRNLARAGATLLTRTTAFGYYDGNLVGALEQVTDHLVDPPKNLPRQRLWKVRARAVVLASGAIERSIAYPANDRPGTLLASAAQRYVQRYAVRPGSRAVVFTNNDSAHAAAIALHEAGVEVAAVVDARDASALGSGSAQRLRDSGVAIHAAAAIVATRGRLRVNAVDVAPLSGGMAKRVDCDLVCVSGGFNPAVHLFSQARGALRYDEALATFVPAHSPLPIVATGGANGRFDPHDALIEAHSGGARAAQHAGYAAASIAPPHTSAVASTPLHALWAVAAPRQRAKSFVDLQNDVSTADVTLAAREGYQAVEHLKRYTTLGMGTDQGKTSNVLGLALMAQTLDVAIERVGTTTFRPPYTPVTLGAIAGHEVGAQVEPVRRSAMHDWHAAHGARMVNTGLWKRPHSYPRAGETQDDAANREARNVRANVGVVDVSTLGKIELQGRDVVELLNRVYINRWDTLPIGRCRYGVMLREDGMVQDDGTTSRLADTHFLMTTTTVNAVKVIQQLEYLLQVEWRSLDVFVASVTEQWAAAAISGPKSRDVVAGVVDIDVSNAAFPFLAVGECNVSTAAGSVPARLFRMSYSGELAYEIHVPADRGRQMWEAVLSAGESFGIMPYGTEAMGTLRIEKGHIVVGPEADGRTTADDLGLGKLVNAGKGCIGMPLLGRVGLIEPDRWQLVGLTALDSAPTLRGAKLVADPDRAAPNPMLGHVTSWCYSPNLDATIALALLANGRARHGETLWAVSPLAGARTRVKVGAPCFIDPQGERLRG